MGQYVEGFVLPIAAANVEKYREMAQKAGDIWTEKGALAYFECFGDDLDIENMLSFKKLCGASDDETVIFAWIVFESREQRDAVNEAVMNDPRLDCGKDIFDFKRMAYGGFKTLVAI